MRMNKKIIVIGVIIIVLIGITWRVMASGRQSLEYQLETISELDYMVLKENNKFGVIDRKGNILVQPLYDVVQIPNPSKPVFICMYNYNQESKQYTIKVFNDKNEQILYQYIVVEAIGLNDATSIVPYEKSVLKYKDNNKYGLIDFQGNIIAKAKYDKIESLGSAEGLLLVREKGKCGVININGATVLKSEYDLIQSDDYYVEGCGYKKSGFIVGKKKNDKYVYGYMNSKGKKILNFEYDQIERISKADDTEGIYLVAFKNGKAGFYCGNKNVIKHEFEDISYDSKIDSLVLQRSGKQGICDFSGNIIIDINYDNIYTSTQYINAQIGNKVDIIDYNDKQKIDLKDIVGINGTLSDNYAIAITCEEKYKIFYRNTKELSKNEYEYLQHIYDNYFIASVGDQFGIIDDKENVIVDFKYEIMQLIPNTKIVQALYAGKTDFISGDKVITNMPSSEVYLNDNYITIKSDNDIKYMDVAGNLVSYKDVSTSELHAVKQGKKWGFANRQDTVVIQPQYDFVTEFNEYGFAGIKKAGKWGVLNSNGDIVVEPTYIVESNNPEFVGKYYKYDPGYGEILYISDGTEEIK